MMTAPAVLLVTDDLDWHDTCLDCARVVVKYSVPIKIAAVKIVQSTIQSARQCAGPSSDMFLKLVAFLVPLVLEFFLCQLAHYADVEVPQEQAQKKQVSVTQGNLWEAEQQRRRWQNHDRKEEKTVPSWSLDDGQDDVLDTSDEDIAAGRYPF